MWFQMFIVVILQLSVLARKSSLSDMDYDTMPPLFALEEHGRCVRQIGGKYCLIEAHLYSDQSNSLMVLIKDFSSQNIKHFNHSVVDRGICVTKSCKKFIKDRNIAIMSNLNVILEDCINESFENKYGVNAKLSKIHSCDDYKEENQKDYIDFAVAGTLFVLLLINCVASCYDLFCTKKSKDLKSKEVNQYLLSFSVFKNWAYLISQSNDPETEKLKGFYGIKSLMASLVIFGHVPVILVYFCDNPQDFEKTFESESHLMFNLTVLVQVYYVMTSFLLAYNLKIRQKKDPVTWRSVLALLILRLTRLTPVIALTVAFSATWQRYLNSGPLWKMYVIRSANDCRVSWWWHLLFFTNYVINDTKHCAPHLWYASSETQLYFFGIILYAVTQNLSKRAHTLTFTLLIALGASSVAWHVWAYDLEGFVFMGPEFLRSFDNDTFLYSHIYGHVNLPGFIVGMGTGIIVYYWQIKDMKFFKHKRTLHIVSWAVLPCSLAGLASGWILYESGVRASITARMLYAALNRLVFAIIVAVGIASMVMKIGNSVFRTILEWRFWRITSRLSYCTYLLHMNIVLIILGSRTQLAHIDTFHMIILCFGVWTASFLIALPVYLFVEAPFYALAKRLVSSHLNKENKQE